MNTIAYVSPFVPAEWIAAHGLRPHCLRLRAAVGGPAAAVTRGICPYAAALIDQAISRLDASALVLTTTCNQMRHAAALLESRGHCGVFLLNVPATWQTATAGKRYLDELLRLGKFLVGLGGTSPDDAHLAQVMRSYDAARMALRSAPGRFAPQPAGIPLAILGGPLLEADYALFDYVEQLGGRVVLDATEGSRRTMPRALDPLRVTAEPLRELAAAYFDTIPDAFRRPNHRLYEWLARELAVDQVRGILFRRQLWCDLWHAELQRLKQWSALPVLELDAGPDDSAFFNRTRGRIEAFLEMLR